MCHVIDDGVGDLQATAKLMSDLDAQAFFERMREAMVCRISAHRAVPLSPHFAATGIGDEATVVELLTFPAPGSDQVTAARLRTDVYIAVLSLLVTSKFRRIIVPLALERWEMDGVEMHESSEGLVFDVVAP